MIAYVYMELKLRMSTKILAVIKKCLTLIIIQLSQNTMLIQKKLVVGKMKDGTAGVAIEEFIRLKPKMLSFLVDDNSKGHKQKHCCNNKSQLI